MPPAQAAKATGEGYLAGTLLHEISHGLGPAFARVNGKQVDISEAIGPAYSGLEEAKADVVGMFGLKWLVDHGALPEDRLEEYYASYVAGIFRTLRFGTGEAHGRAEMMEFNYLLENRRRGARPAAATPSITRACPPRSRSSPRSCWPSKPPATAPRAEAWFAKYDKMPAELRRARRHQRYSGRYRPGLFVQGRRAVMQECAHPARIAVRDDCGANCPSPSNIR